MIKVMVPDMPTAEELLPYLKLMDQSRIYSNTGPMVLELEASLSAKCTGAPTIAVSNGTLAIELALRSLYLRSGAGVLCPAFTFAATGLAISNAGLRPLLCDVDLDGSWQLTPAIAVKAILHSRWPVSCVVPVATLGVPVDAEAWGAFSREMGIPVIVDAAGALTTQRLTEDRGVMVAYSLHATKFIGAGEGGAVASYNDVLLRRVLELSNFGHEGTNAKMSEYHAAVALASLVRAEKKRDGSKWLSALYYEALKTVPGLHFQRDHAKHAVMMPVLLPEGCTSIGAAEWLAKDSIETKQWYRPFLDERNQFSGSVYGVLPATAALRQRYLGLPFHKLVEEAHVLTVADSLRRYVEFTKERA